MRLHLALLFSFLTIPAFAQVSVTIDSLPSNVGARFKVTGANCQAGEYPAPATLSWTAGPACQVEFLLPYVVNAGTRYAFVAWDDQSSTPAISIPVPAANATRYVRLRTEYLVTAEARPLAAATVTGGGWLAAGATASIHANVNPGFVFLNWQSVCCSTYTYPDPLTIEFPVGGAGTVIAAMRITTAPLPRPYTLTSMPGVWGSVGGALTADGSVAGFADVPAVRSVFVWQPERPNGAMGSVLDIPELVGAMAGPMLLANDLGRLLYSDPSDWRYTVWTPLARGAVTGTAAAIQEPSNLSRGQAVAFNRFGQIAATFGNAAGLWTPSVAGGTTGTTLLDAQFSVIQAMNDFGQVLVAPGYNSGNPIPLGFRLFTPAAANSATGTFTLVSPPQGTTSTRIQTINSRGDVAGIYCITYTGGACQSRILLWQPTSPNTTTGVTTDIAPPAGFAGVSLVSAMNTAGEIGGTMNIDSSLSTPFLRTGGVFYDLMQVPGVPATAVPIGINDAGQVLLSDTTNTTGLFLLTPQPTPQPPAPNAVAVTIAASAGGGGFAVSGGGCQPGEYSAPSTLQWTPGSTCQVRWLAIQFAGPQRRRVFAGWSDGQSINPRTFGVPTTAATYTAHFRDEVYISVAAFPAQSGTTTGSGWYQLGSSLVITATANVGFRFSRWVESYTSVFSTAVLQIKADLPRLYTAAFAYTTPLPHTYTVTSLVGMGTDSLKLNNRGQVVSFKNENRGNVTLWTPTQANGTAGAVTTITGFGSADRYYNSAAVALNDSGQIALRHPDVPLQVWAPSTPNGTQGQFSVINISGTSPMSTLKAMNNYGQIFGSFTIGDGFWTPSTANGLNGSLTILDGSRQILAANDYGQLLLPSGSSSNSLMIFTPAAPNTASGSYFSFAVPNSYASYYSTFAMNARGAVVLAATQRLSSGVSVQQPVLWTPRSNNGSTGSSEPLPIPEGFTEALPIAINSKSEVAGHAKGVNREWTTPFVFTQGRFYAIEGIPGVPDGSTVAGFNDVGQLLLRHSYTNALFLLTPQSAPASCPVTTSRLQETVGPAGGRVTISVRLSSNCSWTAAATDSWLGISGAAAGTGNGTLLIDVPRNTAGAARTSYITINGASFSIRQTLLPYVSFYPSSLRILVGAKGATGPQDVQIRMNGTGTVTATMNAVYSQYVTTSFVQGVLPAVMAVSYKSGSSNPVSSVAYLTVSLTGADQPSLTLPVTIDVLPPGTPSAPPFGSFDTPADNATNLAGSFAVTGWALDDIGVDHVEVWRDRVGNEPVFPNGKVFIGNGVFVPDARPDVEAYYPTLPQNRRAGWGYLMLTTGLPNPNGPAGNGVFTLEAIAVDREGNRTSLGRKTITVNNAASKKPFGAIDTPDQGATISGAAYLNWGWALTPKPNTIPRDGHTIRMDIDGVPQGTINYNHYRKDIADGFPNYINSDAAVGYSPIDTTKLTNGIHSIGWLVSDDQGNMDGIGSRFFQVLNSGTGGAVAPAPEAPRTAAAAAYDGDRLVIDPLGRVEFQLPTGGADADWEGALVAGDEKRPLPVGSTLDGSHGRFYWRLAPGYRGDYELEFTNRATGATHRVTVRVAHSESEREER